MILKKSPISIIFSICCQLNRVKMALGTARQRLILKVQKPLEVPIFRPISIHSDALKMTKETGHRPLF